MVQNKNPRPHNQVRIIAGKWRGRKLSFSPIQDLRPTPDRVRETLFNWLQFDLVGKRCLDLFAGSGVLGFEAASRGATTVSLLESHPTAVRQLQQNVALLKADNIEIIAQDAIKFLQHTDAQSYDVIFLDPPYKLKLLQACIAQIEEKRCLAERGILYFEQATTGPGIDLSTAWTITHKKSAGQVCYCLATFSSVAN
ncbi:MAG: 16S rRNA (guanine(966)-N(2))-methyltransferase RsmD [Thiohalomonadales bacterium]